MVVKPRTQARRARTSESATLFLDKPERHFGEDVFVPDLAAWWPSARLALSKVPRRAIEAT